MKFIENNQKKYKRHSIRIKGYDYSKEGLYFITVCTQNRKEILSSVGAGPVSAQKIKLTYTGKIIEDVYINLEKEFRNVKLHNYIIMPNHIHGIIEIKMADTGPAPTIGDIICSFKTRTTGYIIKEIKKGKIEAFEKRLWQRNYYEHVIRNEKEYWQIYKYIENNPLNWNKDEYYLT